MDVSRFIENNSLLSGLPYIVVLQVIAELNRLGVLKDGFIDV